MVQPLTPEQLQRRQAAYEQGQRAALQFQGAAPQAAPPQSNDVLQQISGWLGNDVVKPAMERAGMAYQGLPDPVKTGLEGAGWLLDTGNRTVTRPVGGALFQGATNLGGQAGGSILDNYLKSMLLGPAGLAAMPVGVIKDLQDKWSPERAAAIQQAPDTTAAWEAAYEGDPLGQLAVEGVYDPLNVAGAGVGKAAAKGLVTQAAKLGPEAERIARLGGTAIEKADALVDKVQRAPIEIPVGLAKRGAQAANWATGGNLAKGMQHTAQAIGKRGAAGVKTATEAELDVGIPDIQASLYARAYDEAATNPAALPSLDEYSVGRVFQHATDTGDAATAAAALADLTSRGLTSSSGVPTHKFQAHLALDDASAGVQFGDFTRENNHDLLDVLASATYRDNPKKFSNDPDNAYEGLITRFTDDTSTADPDALFSTWVVDPQNKTAAEKLLRDMGEMLPSQELEARLTGAADVATVRPSGSGMAGRAPEDWFLRSAAFLNSAGFDHRPFFKDPARVQALMSHPEAQRTLAELQLDPEQVAQRLGDMTKQDVLLNLLGATSIAGKPWENLYTTLRSYKALLDGDDISKTVGMAAKDADSVTRHGRGQKAYAALFSDEGFRELGYLKEKAAGDLAPEQLVENVPPGYHLASNKPEEYASVLRGEMEAVETYARVLQQTGDEEAAWAAFREIREANAAFPVDRHVKRYYTPRGEWVDPARILDPDATGPVLTRPEKFFTPVKTAALKQRAAEDYARLTGRPNPYTGEILDDINPEAAANAERFPNFGSFQGRMWGFGQAERDIAEGIQRDLLDPTTGLMDKWRAAAAQADDPQATIKQLFADELETRYQAELTSGKLGARVEAIPDFEGAAARSQDMENLRDPEFLQKATDTGGSPTPAMVAAHNRALRTSVKMPLGEAWNAIRDAVKDAEGYLLRDQTPASLGPAEVAKLGNRLGFPLQELWQQAQPGVARGSFKIDKATGLPTISLTPEAGATTLPHELAHFFTSQAGQGTRRSLRADVYPPGIAPARGFDREGHEAVAGGVENLLMELDPAKLSDPALADLLRRHRMQADAEYFGGRPSHRFGPATGQRLAERLDPGAARGAVGAPSDYATPPAVSDTAPLAQSTPETVVRKMAGELRLDPADPGVPETVKGLDKLFEAAGQPAQASVLANAVGPYRKHVEAMLTSADEAERATHLSALADEMNQTQAMFGIRHPGLKRMVDAVAPSLKRQATTPGATGGRSSFGSSLSDANAAALNQARSLPKVAEWEREFKPLYAKATRLAEADGIDLNRATYRDVGNWANHRLTGTDRSDFDKLLKLGGLVDPGTGKFRELYSAGMAEQWLNASAKALGIPQYRPSNKFLEGFKTVMTAWRETALISVRKHTQDIADMTFKSAVEGVNPMRGASVYKRAEGYGIMPPTAAHHPRAVYADIENLAEFAAYGDKSATGKIVGVINPKLGEAADTAVSTNQALSRATESTYRLSAWMAGFERHVQPFREVFYKDLQKTFPGQPGKDIVARLKAKDAFSRADVADAIRAEGGAIQQAEEYAARWSRGLQEASQEGIDLSNRVHFDVNDERVLEQKLGLKYWLGFHYWATRNIPYYTQTLAENPWLMRAWSNYNKLSEEEREEGGLTARFAGKLPLPDALTRDPFLAGILGHATPYFNPIVIMSIADQMKPRAEDRDETGLGRAIHTLGKVGLSPAPWIDIPLTAAGVYGEHQEIGNVGRQTGLINAALSKQANRAIDIEGPIKGAVRHIQGAPAPISETTVGGIPFGGSSYVDYAISKKLSEMSVTETGLPRHPDYVQAMADPSSPLYQRASAQVWADTLRDQSLGFTSPIPVSFLPDTEAAIRARRADVQDTTRGLDPAQMTLVNRQLADSGDLATSYWNATSDPRIAQINAGMSDRNDGGRLTSLGSYLRQQQNPSQYQLAEMYRQWLKTLPPGADRSAAAFVKTLR